MHLNTITIPPVFPFDSCKAFHGVDILRSFTSVLLPDFCLHKAS